MWQSLSELNIVSEISVTRLTFAVVQNDFFKVLVAHKIEIFQKFRYKSTFSTVGPAKNEVNGCLHGKLMIVSAFFRVQGTKFSRSFQFPVSQGPIRASRKANEIYFLE